jgi:two-component system CheB/CheR fusion protein
MQSLSLPRVAQSPAELSFSERAAYEDILALMFAKHAVDFRRYRQATIVRRVQNRMISANVRGYANYLERLRADPEETQHLLERLTIKVSRFFRCPEAFESLSTAIQRRLALSPGPIVAWSAGCACGEEAYSLAIVLAELGHDHASASIWATDIDASALEWARRGRYARSSLEGVPSHRMQAHFSDADSDGTRAVKDDIRQRVAFEVHDLCSAQSLRRTFDVICCRNTLIYFRPELQRYAQWLLSQKLRPGGLLLLGEAEWLHADLAPRFDVLDRRGRLFQLK